MVGEQHIAKVIFRQSRDCFISVPQTFLPSYTTDKVVVFRLLYRDGSEAFFTWSNEVTSVSDAFDSKNSTVEINGLLALKLGISEDDQVVVNVVKGVPSLESLTAVPVAADDWEILNLHSEFIQDNLLSQVRVVWIGQVLPVWVENNVCLFVKISGLSPASPVGLLEQLTEVHVAPLSGMTSTDYQLNKVSTEMNAQCFYDEVSKSEHATLLETQEANVAGNQLSLWETFYNWIFVNKDTNVASVDDELINDNCSDLFLTNLRNVDVTLRVHSLRDIEDVFLEQCACFHVSDISVHLSNLQKTFLQPTSVFLLSSSLPFDVVCNNVEDLGRMCRVYSSFEASEKSNQTNKSIIKNKLDVNDSSSSKTSTTDLSKKQLIKPTQATEIGNCFVKVVLIDNFVKHLDEILCRSKHCFALWLLKSMVPGSVYVPDCLRRQFGYELFSKVRLEFAMCKLTKLDSIVLQPQCKLDANLSPDDLCKDVCNWLQKISSSSCPLVASYQTVFEVSTSSGHKLDLVLKINESLVEKEKIPLLITPKVKVELVLDPFGNIKLPVCVDPSAVGQKSMLLGGIDDLVYRGLVFLKATLAIGLLSRHLQSSGSLRRGSLLICGPLGSGKTTLAQTLARDLFDTAYRVYCTYVACKTLKGKRVESVARIWQRAFQEAMYRSPSVVILDDLDHLVGASNGPEHEASNYQVRLSETLQDMLKVVSTSHDSRVVVLATCLSSTSLHASLVSAQGSHLFHDILEICKPSLEERDKILQCLVLSKLTISSDTLRSVDWRQLATQTEGFVARDLEMIVDRAIHSAAGNSNEESELLLTMSDFEAALSNFVPMSLQGLQLQNYDCFKGWDDIGGLAVAKKTLLETLLWPSKYPFLFAQSPLPMRSGILLYGPPGTGKTLLAGAVAKECRMNFISIKGPELLSKYIGASEHSVRDLFQRASSAKPCIIFFDEFDSLASKRGHDSTGVTDRVVNQLLTQMDGIEGRQGVYVLAATSRPDLIDPALLRPGRLDKCVFCPLPSLEDRLEILRALIRSVKIMPDVDLTNIAARSHHFSGADLQGLLCNAQLNAIHRTTPINKFRCTQNTNDNCYNERSNSEAYSIPDCEDVVIYVPSLEDGVVSLDDNVDLRDEILDQVNTVVLNIGGQPIMSAKDKVCGKLGSGHFNTVIVTLEDILAAFTDTKPSVSSTERQRYDKIYETFLKSKSGYFGMEVSGAVQQRATLA